MTGWPSERSRNGGVDEVPLPKGPGRLWLCGKHFIGPDVEAALHRVGATTVVCLNERDELAGRYDDYVRWLTDARVIGGSRLLQNSRQPDVSETGFAQGF